MSKTPKKTPLKAIAKRAATEDTVRQPDFDEVLRLIDAAQARAVAAVNTALIDLYWSIGEYISQQDRGRRLGRGNRRGVWPSTSGERHPNDEGLFRPQPLADAAVLRDLPRSAKTRQHC